jgi:hypothetical protein
MSFDAGPIHAGLMIGAWIFLSEIAETIAWYCSNRTNMVTKYFKVIENGERWFNLHRGCMCLAFVAGLIGWIVVLAAEGPEAYEARQPAYGTAMMVGAAHSCRSSSGSSSPR